MSEKKRRYKDLTGQKFGKLTVTGYHHTTDDKKIAWSCICECGGKIIVLGKSLKAGKKGTRSCGCMKVGLKPYGLFDARMDEIMRCHYLVDGGPKTTEIINVISGKNLTLNQIYSRARYLGLRLDARKYEARKLAAERRKRAQQERKQAQWDALGPMRPELDENWMMCLCKPWRPLCKLSNVPYQRSSGEYRLYSDKEALRLARKYIDARIDREQVQRMPTLHAGYGESGRRIGYVPEPWPEIIPGRGDRSYPAIPESAGL